MKEHEVQHAETSLRVGESGELGVAALKEKRKYSHDKTLLKNKTNHQQKPHINKQKHNKNPEKQQISNHLVSRGWDCTKVM